MLLSDKKLTDTLKKDKTTLQRIGIFWLDEHLLHFFIIFFIVSMSFPSSALEQEKLWTADKNKLLPT